MPITNRPARVHDFLEEEADQATGNTPTDDSTPTSPLSDITETLPVTDMLSTETVTDLVLTETADAGAQAAHVEPEPVNAGHSLALRVVNGAITQGFAVRSDTTVVMGNIETFGQTRKVTYLLCRDPDNRDEHFAFFAAARANPFTGSRSSASIRCANATITRCVMKT
jgi:hypothetical protein